jgi:hypothetical protein
MQVSIGSFRFFLNRQNEYVETAIGLGRRDFAMLSPAKVWVLDENELRPMAPAAATERPRKVLRLIDFIICFSKYYFLRTKLPASANTNISYISSSSDNWTVVDS